jgi:N-acetylmuramoyl-L-alanine amidase
MLETLLCICCILLIILLLIVRRRQLSKVDSRFCPAFLVLFAALAVAGCSHNRLARWVPSDNHEARRAVIVVIHATQQSSAKDSLDTLRSRNPGGRVSAHYLVGRDGRIYQLVSERRRAWHAGGGRWGTITDLNSASIGIELDNDGASDFPEPQVAALLVLLADICDRQEIPRTQVIGHADLAPWRKSDPGARFPWQRLAQAGFGRWPDARAVDSERPPGFDGFVALQLLGYPMRDPQAALRAFRLHYRGLDDASSPMSGADEALLYGLTAESWRIAPPIAPAGH